jgi:hypothetical protein
MAITKRVRFEVFKRDSFTCQYCGRKSPDVILHVDHIEPKSKGGKNDLLNLITSCADCNHGKGARKLDDASAVEKQRRQLEELQARREQIGLMIEWQKSLVDMGSEEVDQAANFWCDLADWSDLTQAGREKLRRWLRRHGLAEVLAAMRIAAEQYIRYDDNGGLTKESTEYAYGKVGGVCQVAAAAETMPYLRDVFYIRGIIRNTLSYVNDRQAKEYLIDAFEAGADAETLRAIARDARSWTAWRERMEEHIGELATGEGA